MSKRKQLDGILESISNITHVEKVDQFKEKLKELGIVEGEVFRQGSFTMVLFYIKDGTEVYPGVSKCSFEDVIRVFTTSRAQRRFVKRLAEGQLKSRGRIKDRLPSWLLKHFDDLIIPDNKSRQDLFLREGTSGFIRTNNDLYYVRYRSDIYNEDRGIVLAAFRAVGMRN